jgi:tyrosine-protein phosphatase SIW14
MRPRILSLLAAGLALGACVSTPRGPLAEVGLPNFAKVDTGLYRGGQPTESGIEELARQGVATVLDLRRADEKPPTRAAERAAVERLHMAYQAEPMSGLGAPRRAVIERLLALIEDPGRGPVFVHCKRGADRTGTVVAIYRLRHDCWSAEEAIREARRRGMAWFEFGMRRLIRAWYRDLEAAGCTPAADAARPPGAMP